MLWCIYPDGTTVGFEMANVLDRKVHRLVVQEWLVRQGRSEADAACIRDGFKDALGKGTLAVLSFRDFARTFPWFVSTLQMMAAQQVPH